MRCRGHRPLKNLVRLRVFALLALFSWVLSGDTLRAQEPVAEELRQVRQELANQQGVIEQLLRQAELQQRQLDELQPSFPHQERTEAFITDSAASADAAPPVPRLPDSSPRGLQYGYSDGFFVTSPNGVKIGARDAPFTMKVNFRTQLRYSYFSSEGTTSDENNFEFERAFLIFTGNVFTPDLAYHIKLDGDSDDAEGLDLLDAFASYDLGHDVLDWTPGTFGIKAGKWKVPFHRSRQESGFNLQLVDRAMASEFFDINRSIGAGLFGRLDFLPRPVIWEAAVFNGFQTQKFVPGRAGELDRNLAVAARVNSDLVGDYGTDGESDLSFHDCLAVRVGAAFAHTRIDKLDGLREFSVPRVIDSGATLASLLPATVTEFDETLYSVDANFKYRGLSVLFEHYFRSISDFSGAPVPSLFDHGFMLQGGYFLIPEKLEVSSRWSRVVGNSGTLGRQDQSADEVAGAITWFIRKQNLKLACDVTHLNGAPINSTATNIRPKDDGWLFRTQFQFMF